jgi:DNA-binding winged helix-turn-helix (wHTH) protein
MPLRPKPFALLACLVAHASQVVTKDRLFEAVWPETVVSEGMLKDYITQIRKTLGDTPHRPQYIATVHRRGYRFVAPVTTLERSSAGDAAQTTPVAADGAPGSRPTVLRPPGLVVAREVELAQLRQGLTALLATGQTLARPLYLVLLAEAAGHTGQVEEGLRLLAEALAAIETIGRGELLADTYRLQGELRLRQAVPDAAQAEVCFHQALAVARRQQAKSWELRAAISLSRLWQQQGKRDNALALLAPIYGWITEGFGTADLQAAKALLEDLCDNGDILSPSHGSL